LLSAELGEVFERRREHPAVQIVVVVVERAEAAVLGAGDAREQDAVLEDAPGLARAHDDPVDEHPARHEVLDRHPRLRRGCGPGSWSRGDAAVEVVRGVSAATPQVSASTTEASTAG
jgi:hypothetical protein